MHRIWPMLVMTFVVAVTLLFWGMDVTNAEPDSSSATQDLAVQDRASSAAARARAQRADMLKKRKEAQKYIQKVIEGQQPRSATGAEVMDPDKADKEVPK